MNAIEALPQAFREAFEAITEEEIKNFRTDIGFKQHPNDVVIGKINDVEKALFILASKDRRWPTLAYDLVRESINTRMDNPRHIKNLKILGNGLIVLREDR